MIRSQWQRAHWLWVTELLLTLSGRLSPVYHYIVVMVVSATLTCIVVYHYIVVIVVSATLTCTVVYHFFVVIVASADCHLYSCQ